MPHVVGTRVATALTRLTYLLICHIIFRLFRHVISHIQIINRYNSGVRNVTRIRTISNDIAIGYTFNTITICSNYNSIVATFHCHRRLMTCNNRKYILNTIIVRQLARVQVNNMRHCTVINESFLRIEDVTKV